ncbi:MAG: hypothetical protein SPF04_03140 [Bacilli bacterium]|nr:hypothetical protein [Bacilli bacterium]MDY5996533.1 hypothetical protein [Bacilli bacterium]
MKFKKFIFVLVITSILAVAGMWGTSYAYYVSTNGTNFNVTTANVDTSLTVVFNQSEYMNMKTGVPISASDVDNYASKSVFTILPNNTLLNGYQVAVNISLINIKIDDALKVSDFKYKLTCSDGSTTTNLGSGTGASFTSDVLKNDSLSLGSLSTSANTFNASKTYTCTLRVWLQDSGSSQNNLMNKSFSGLVKVGTAIKK